MFYHIGRMLIDENFDGQAPCPLCRIRAKVELRLAEQYLGEGVMEDDTRKEVNELGFCERHFTMLYKMPSKLGLALQTSTRLKRLEKEVFLPKNAAQAKKQAKKLQKLTNSCVICKYLDEHLVRYYKTVAEVFASDPAFKSRIENSDGFCLSHYASLMEYSAYAGAKSKEYAKTLYEAQSKKLDFCGEKIDEFCRAFDYRSAAAPLGKEARDALPDAQALLYGIKKD